MNSRFTAACKKGEPTNAWLCASYVRDRRRCRRILCDVIARKINEEKSTIATAGAKFPAVPEIRNGRRL